MAMADDEEATAASPVGQASFSEHSPIRKFLAHMLTDMIRPGNLPNTGSERLHKMEVKWSSMSFKQSIGFVKESCAKVVDIRRMQKSVNLQTK